MLFDSMTCRRCCPNDCRQGPSEYVAEDKKTASLAKFLCGVSHVLTGDSCKKNVFEAQAFRPRKAEKMMPPAENLIGLADSCW